MYIQREEAMKKFKKNIILFLGGVLCGLLFILITWNFGDDKEKIEFVDQMAKICQQWTNHYENGDDEYTAYYDLNLTESDYVTLFYIVEQTDRKKDYKYIYMENNTKSTKRKWYIITSDICYMQKDVKDEKTVRYQVFDVKTFTFKDITRAEFEKYEKEELNAYSECFFYDY